MRNRWERQSLGKLLSKVSVAEMERAGPSKRLPLLASVNGGELGGEAPITTLSLCCLTAENCPRAAAAAAIRQRRRAVRCVGVLAC